MAQPASAPPEDRLRSHVETPALRDYLSDLYRRRQFTWALATGSLRSQHLDTVLGNVWHVLNPMFLSGVYYLIFGVLIGTSRGVDNFVGFLVVGVFTFQLGQKTVMACGSSLANNVGLMRSLQFPRAVLPISTVIRELLGYGFAFAVMLGILVGTGEVPTLSWLLAPVLVVLMTIFTTGLGMFVARLTERVRDLSNLLPYIFRILFYASGIIFALDVFVENETLLSLMTLNPFFVYIDLLRDLLMPSYDAVRPFAEWVVALTVGPVVFVAGVLFFRAGEKSYGRG